MCSFVCFVIDICSRCIRTKRRTTEISNVKHVKAGKDLLSVKLREIELASIPKEIFRQAGIRIQIDELGRE
jgi:hypothetical protein